MAMDTSDDSLGQVPLMGSDGLWSRASASGGRIDAFAKFVHRPTKREIPVAIEFSRPLGERHLQNELAAFSLCRDRVTCGISAGLPEVYCGRIQALMPVLLPYFQTAELDGNFDVSLGDEGLCARVLSFCSIIPDFLIPDPYFVVSNGYANERDVYAQIPWRERRDQLYWRGTDTGAWRYRGLPDAPRVALCLLAKACPELIDAKITQVEPTANEAEKRTFYEMHGLLGPWQDQSEILNYRYQIDIDGNTSTWSGFFLKLLTGSPVLKVESECCWRQWYYDRLKPGEHYVPVRADLADLMEKLQWLRANPVGAQSIGQAGRDFALSMDYASEVQRAITTVDKLVMLNRKVAFG
mgnify:CR=1 FL=1